MPGCKKCFRAGGGNNAKAKVKRQKLKTMDELRAIILRMIEEAQSAYISADECGYRSHRDHYGNRIKKLNKALKALR